MYEPISDGTVVAAKRYVSTNIYSATNNINNNNINGSRNGSFDQTASDVEETLSSSSSSISAPDGGDGGGGGTDDDFHHQRHQHQQHQQQQQQQLLMFTADRTTTIMDDNERHRPHCDNDGGTTGMGDNCIDVDQIKLERHKTKTKQIGTQTTHLTPYRLRFWPVGASDNLKCIDATFADIVKCCLKTLSQWFLSQVGLTVILIFWALLGAAAFYKTEGPREREQSEELSRLKGETAVDLATDLRQLEGFEGWTKVIEKYLNKHENLVLEAVSAGFGEGGSGSIWTYPGCILFAVSLLTTLGFGAPVPRTPLGRGTAVLFSAIGIPLHFLLILNIGHLAARTLGNLATIKSKSDVPENSANTTTTAKRKWYKWFPLVAIAIYYTSGVVLFGVVRNRPAVDCFMFPLDFTAAGGVAKTSGHVRILYALYLEFAMMLTAIIASMLQASASRGVIDLGLRLGLLTNT